MIPRFSSSVPEIKLWNSNTSTCDGAAVIPSLGVKRQPLSIEENLSPKDQLVSEEYAIVIPHGHSLRLRERRFPTTRRKTIKVGQSEQPEFVPELGRYFCTDSTVHSAFLKSILRPALAKNKSVSYDSCSKELKVKDQVVGVVGVYSLSHAVGLGMMMHFGRDLRPFEGQFCSQALRNFYFAFSQTLQRAIKQNCTRFIITDYLYTGMFELLSGVDQRHARVNYEACNLSESVPATLKFLTRCVERSIWSRRKIAKLYYNTLSLQQCGVGGGDDGGDLNEDLDRTAHLHKFVFHQQEWATDTIQTGHGYYAQTLVYHTTTLTKVIKVFDARFYPIDCQVSAETLFHNELEAYRRLQPLQGRLLPKVYNYGRLMATKPGDLCGPYILLEYIEHAKTKRRLPYDIALDAVEILHAYGVAHNDIRNENMLYDGKRVVIIDFAQSRRRTDDVGLERRSSSSFCRCCYERQSADTEWENDRVGDLQSLATMYFS